MSVIYLVRHAQAEGNLFRRYHGWYDGSPTPLGLAQIAALTERFKDIPIQAVYSSDLRRTRATAQAAAAPHHLEIQDEPGLRELHLGIYEDFSYGEFVNSHSEDHQRFLAYSPQFAPLEGETFLQLSKRMTETISRIARAHPAETVALFSHCMAIHCFQAALRDLCPDEFQGSIPPNTGVSCYEIQGDKLRVIFENDASHLSPALRKPRPAPLPLQLLPMDLDREAELYRTARADAWLQVFPDLLAFDGPGFLAEAKEQLLWDPRALQQAVLDGQTVGILQLDTLRGAQGGVGHIPFLWVREDLRRKGVGAILMGQAVSCYRSMGRERLRLRCSPGNRPAQQFYRKLGFYQAGTVPGALGNLDVLEKKL